MNHHGGPGCLVCGGNVWRTIRQDKDPYRPGSRTTYEFAKCLSCGLVAQQPLPSESELQAAYAISHPVFRAAWRCRSWPLWKILRTLTVARRLRLLRCHANGRELLEVGCGAGDFLLAARDAGWRVRAVEYSNRMAEALRREMGLDVRTGELLPGMWPRDAFDVVVFWDVLEHVRDPLAALESAEDCLRPGGLVLLSFPTDTGVERGHRFGGWWAILDPPRHLYFFNQTTLSHICARAGLKLVQYRTPALDTVWCHLASAWRYADQRVGIPRQLLRFAGWAVVTALILPYLVTQSWRRRGLNAVAVAIKRETSKGGEGIRACAR